MLIYFLDFLEIGTSDFDKEYNIIKKIFNIKLLNYEEIKSIYD